MPRSRASLPRLIDEVSVRALGSLSFACGALLFATATVDAQPYVPPALQPWREWVLKDVPDHACAHRGEEALCVWPGRLALDLDAHGGKLEQQVVVDNETFLGLPGAAGRWPLDVQVDGRAAAVIDQGGVPMLQLQPGGHRVSGRFEWAALPERLELAAGTALVDLRVEGKAVAFPRRDEQGQLWLLAQSGGDREGEQLALIVSRKLQDGVPMLVTTRIALRVAGRAREVNLGHVLLPGTRPLSMSSELPARLEEQGELRVQVRAGTYRIEITARSERALDKIAFASAGPAWPESEVWVWQANEALRQVELGGALGVDPNRTELDGDWRGLPACVLRAGSALVLTTVRRGEATPPPNRVTLDRELWLDLDGRGYTVRDQLQAELHQGFRLDLLDGELGHVSADGEDQLITKGAHGKGAGVELRKQQQSLIAEWRAPERLSTLPAVGWSEDVQSLAATLHLGPGYSVFATSGVDSIDQSWITDWDLFALFFVLLCSIAVARLCGNRYLPLALATLVLCEQEADAPGFVWVALLVLIALLRVLPRSWFRNLVRAGYAIAVLSLLLVAVPFAGEQIRGALHPQLGSQGDGQSFGMPGFGLARKSMVEDAAPPTPIEEEVAAPAAPEPQPAADMLAASRAAGGAVREQLQKSKSDLSYEQQSGYASALRQDPEATLQTGPGVPTWSWRSWRLSWSGPVDHAHEIALYLIPPWLNRLLAVLRVLLLGWLIAVLLRSATAGQDKPGGSSERPHAPASAVGAAAALLIALLAGSGTARAQASDIPDQTMLDALRARLTEPPPCQPDCAAIEQLALDVNARELSLTLTVHAQATTSIALPGPVASWVPASTSLDGHADAPLVLRPDGFLHARVDAGVHTLALKGAIPPSDTLTLAVPDRPKRGRVHAEGFKVDGVREDGQVEAALQLSRLLASDSGSLLAGAALPPWLTLERSFELGPTWVAHNRLTRVSATGTPLRVRVPLLAGESVTDAAIDVVDGDLQISFGRDEHEVEWSSRLQTRDKVELTAASGRPFSERWTIACGPIWHCTLDGLAPIGHGNGQAYAPEFAPWPGEKLQLNVGRPEPAPGHSVTIDSATMVVTPGVRMRAAELTLELRTSRGANQTLELPRGAKVLSQTIDGEARPIRMEGSKLRFTLGPGAHQADVHWQEPDGMAMVETIPPVDLHLRASNVRISVNVPSDRWLLWADGPDWGPAILFWGYLALVVLLALALGRTAHSPLRTYQWLLLGLGLTQIPAPAALCVVMWFFAMSLRARMPEQSRWPHNLMQIALAWFTLGALGCLYGAVHTGLLLEPEMQVAGAGSYGSLLHWYIDQTDGALPSVTVVSVPLWVWRLLMLLWSLWLARSLVEWLPWSFRCFKTNGLWKKKPAKPAATPLTTPTAVPAAPIEPPPNEG
jgi:hypothetical protein